MSFEVLSEDDRAFAAAHGTASWNGWARQYVAYDPASRGLTAVLPVTVHGTVSAIGAATAKAGASGTVIFNVGHGGAGPDPTRYPFEGVVDIAPNRLIRLVGTNPDQARFISVFYDVMDRIVAGLSSGTLASDRNVAQQCKNKKNPPSRQDCARAASNLDHWQKYQLISQTVAQSHIYKAVLLSCRVGRSPEFIKKIANDWNVLITAFQHYIVVDDMYAVSAGSVSSVATNAVSSGQTLQFASTSGMAVGMLVTGPQIPQNATIASVSSDKVTIEDLAHGDPGAISGSIPAGTSIKIGGLPTGLANIIYLAVNRDHNNPSSARSSPFFPKTAAEAIRAATQIPLADEYNSVTVGPPLPVAP
jgi:hypothetical protein